MPMYLYQCPTCRSRFEILKKLAEIDEPELCRHDGFAMNREICAPFVRGDYAGYECPVTGKWVEGRKAHEENLARTGCRLLEPGESTSAAQYRRNSEHQLLEKVGETAERLVHELPVEKREKLITELQSGADCTISRSAPKFN